MSIGSRMRKYRGTSKKPISDPAAGQPGAESSRSSLPRGRSAGRRRKRLAGLLALAALLIFFLRYPGFHSDFRLRGGPGLYQGLGERLFAVCQRTAGELPPFARHGELRVTNGMLLDGCGERFIMQGVALVDFRWDSRYINRDIFAWMRDEWNVNTIRIAVPPDMLSGVTAPDGEDPTELLDRGIRLASELGLYVIVDWHVLEDGDPRRRQAEAEEFFSSVSERYAGQGNILYEICNEPNGKGGSWDNIRSYARKIIPVIRRRAPEAVIIVGTPDWSGSLAEAMEKPLSEENLLYAYHFYAASHKEDRQRELEEALERSFPVVVSEFALSEQTGDGAVNIKEGDLWISLLDRYSVGRVCYNLSNLPASSSLLAPACERMTALLPEDLTEQGRWLMEEYTHRRTAPLRKESAAAEDGEGRLRAELRTEDCWEKDGRSYTKFVLRITNIGKTTLPGWQAEAGLDEEAVLSESWSAEYQTLDSGLLITGLSWNSEIAPGESEEAGFIVRAEDRTYLQELSCRAQEAP